MRRALSTAAMKASRFSGEMAMFIPRRRTISTMAAAVANCHPDIGQGNTYLQRAAEQDYQPVGIEAEPPGRDRPEQECVESGKAEQPEGGLTVRGQEKQARDEGNAQDAADYPLVESVKSGTSLVERGIQADLRCRDMPPLL